MLYKFMPIKYKKKVESLLKQSGSKRNAKNFFNTSFFLSMILGIVAGILVREYFLPLLVIIFIAIFSLLHGFLVLAIERRTKFVETILPDALQLVAANSRAGYIPSRALMLSARKEFGPLSEAIKKAGKDMLTGESVEEALRKIPRYIKSEVLEKTVNLIIEGSKSGGHLASLLEENAEDIRRAQVLQKEIRANVVMYTIFIGFAGVVAAPILYSLSSFLINTIGSIGSSAIVPEAVFSSINFIQFGGVDISPDFLFWFSFASVFITTFFGGILIGSISTGSEKAGIKYVPIFMAVGFTLFFLSSSFVNGLFGILIPGA